MEKLQYPVGRFTYQPYNEAQRIVYIDTIRQLPQHLRTEADGLTATQLQQAYRPGGWTARQVIHHMADSHMNAYIRFKLILTEDNPTIKPYNEKAWAELNDTKDTPLEASLRILEGLHERWVNLLESIPSEAWARTGFHPEQQRTISLMEFLALYEWHCRHHLAHISLVAKG
ncbi:MAG: putative metal-dependent hydrolase [Phaeodactylibacter sp.]|nr:putative metal-dependent hydrolase [Phaeodactylibacter sp.]MCB9302473.1 putative metal-dependent hydrolase [Lewinellaceae bacterium]